MNRKLITLRRICASGIKNFFRNSWLSIAATAVMVVALVIVLMSVVLNVTARNAIAELSKNLKVSVYLKEGAENDEIKKLQRAIYGNTTVVSVDHVTTVQAQEQFAQSFQNDKKLLEGLALVGGNSLPASLEISVKDLSQLQAVGSIAEQDQYKSIVESVSLGKTDVKRTIERAGASQRFITTASIIAAAVFAVVSMLIIFNTIRMAIFTRSDEIRTMKLLGATPGYIRGPFLVESSMYGIVAGIIAASVVVAGVVPLGSKVANQAEFAATYEFFTTPTVIVGMYASAIMAGVLVGVVSSTLAMEKHLKLKHW